MASKSGMAYQQHGAVQKSIKHDVLCAGGYMRGSKGFRGQLCPPHYYFFRSLWQHTFRHFHRSHPLVKIDRGTRTPLKGGASSEPRLGTLIKALRGQKNAVLVHGTEVLQMLSWLRRKPAIGLDAKINYPLNDSRVHEP